MLVIEAPGGVPGRNGAKNGTGPMCAVNREGVDLQQVKILPGNWVAPAGSYRSDAGR